MIVEVEPETCMECGDFSNDCRSICGDFSGWIAFCPKCFNTLMDRLREWYLK